MRRAISWMAAAVFLLAGCITVFVPVDTPAPPPTPVILPAASPLPSAPSPTAVAFAPFCRADPLAETCAVPQVGMFSKSCIKKIPYTLVGISPGSTFEVLDAGMTCKDESLRGSAHQYSCTGQQLYSYHVKVCNPACSAALAAESGQCPDGYGLSASGGCCWPLPAPDYGCVIYKVDIGGCK